MEANCVASKRSPTVTAVGSRTVTPESSCTTTCSRLCRYQNTTCISRSCVSLQHRSGVCMSATRACCTEYSKKSEGVSLEAACCSQYIEASSSTPCTSECAWFSCVDFLAQGSSFPTNSSQCARVCGKGSNGEEEKASRNMPNCYSCASCTSAQTG